MSSLFIDPSSLPDDGAGFFQVCFLGAVYAVVLYYASRMISDGSELLLLVPSLSGMVGSVILPVLGAVPDGAIVLFSGLGPNAQEQISVGVGSIAGSTIMLLTIPWFLSIYAGRVNLDSKGRGNYSRPSDAGKNWSKLQPPDNKSLKHTGVVFSEEIPANITMMLGTSVIYLLLQAPAFKYTGTEAKDEDLDYDEAADQQKPYALVTLIVSLLAVVFYLGWNIYKTSQVSMDKVDETRVRAIRERKMSLSGVLSTELSKMKNKSSDEQTALNPKVQQKHVENIIRPFFHVYDQDRNNKIDTRELRLFFQDMGERVSNEELESWLEEADKDNSGYLEFDELAHATLRYLITKYEKEQRGEGSYVKMKSIHSEEPPESMSFDDDADDDDEESDVPDDLSGMSVSEQQKRIKIRAAWMTLLGTAFVLLVSDPMVDVLSEVGRRTGIPNFYISFIVAPLASNACEIIASYSYAVKKTSKTASIAVSALLGAVVMNNSLNVAVFAGLMYFKKSALVWGFAAEVSAILFAEVAVGIISIRKTQRLLDACLILAVYPASIVLVYSLKKIFGLD